MWCARGVVCPVFSDIVLSGNVTAFWKLKIFLLRRREVLHDSDGWSDRCSSVKVYIKKTKSTKSCVVMHGLAHYLSFLFNCFTGGDRGGDKHQKNMNIKHKDFLLLSLVTEQANNCFLSELPRFFQSPCCFAFSGCPLLVFLSESIIWTVNSHNFSKMGIHVQKQTY